MTISGQKTQVGFNKLQVQRLHVSQSSPLGISSSPRVEGHMTLHAGQLPLIIILNRVANPGIYYLLSSFSHLSILDKNEFDKNWNRIKPKTKSFKSSLCRDRQQETLIWLV